MMVVGVGVGGVLVAGSEGIGEASLLRAALAAAAVGTAANVHNDLQDLAIDRVNRPDRPLPAGELTPAAARVLAATLAVLGAGLAVTVSALHAALALGSLLLLAVYNVRLKRTPLWGNLAVAAVLGLALPFGGLAVGSWTGPLLIGALFAFGTTLAREAAKDLEDVRGDAADGARTAAVVLGARPVARLAAAVALAMVLLLPAAPGAGLPPSFLVLALPPAAALLAAAWAVLGVPDAADPAVQRARAARASAALKAAMALGLVALAVAAW